VDPRTCKQYLNKAFVDALAKFIIADDQVVKSHVLFGASGIHA
jgi:hypothetical protein